MPESRNKRNETIGEQYTHILHRSGLNIYVIPKKLTTAYALFATRYGAVDNCFRLAGDEEFITVPDGIAHFLEHKMFEAEDGTDTFARYAKTGASANAFTSNTMTAYLFSCTENFSDSLEILLDFVTHPYFTPENVQKEQGIIAQEIRMYEDMPGRCLYYQLLEALYAENHIRINVAGTVESISHITSDILYDCYRTFYNLSNMALIVCGDVTMDEVTAVADRVLPSTAQHIEIERSGWTEPEAVYRKRAESHLEVARPLFAIGIKNNEIGADPRTRLQQLACVNILNEMLFSKTSDFYTELYEEGLISASFDYGFEHTKLYSFNILSGESDEPENVFTRFSQYMEQMKTQGLDADTFARCKRAVYASYLRIFDSTEEIATQFLAMLFDDCDMLDYPEIISGITLEETEAMMKRMYAEPYYTMSVVYPMQSQDA